MNSQQTMHTVIYLGMSQHRTLISKRHMLQYSFLCSMVWDEMLLSMVWDEMLLIVLFIEWKNKKCHTVGTILKSNIKIVERDKINTLKIQIHDRSHSCLGTDTSIKCGWIKLVLWSQIFPLSEMMLSYKYFSHVSKMSTFTNKRANSVIIKNAIILNMILSD